MADMTPLTDILNGNPGSAIPVEGNFQIIEDYINGTDLVRTDGTEVMAANLDMGGFRITNSAIGLVYHGTGAQAFTADQTLTNVTIDTEVFDIGTVGAVGSAVLTVPSTGLYVVVLSGTGTASGGVSYSATPSVGAAFQVGTSTIAADNSVTRQYSTGNTITLAGECGTNASTLTFDVKLYRIA